MHTETHSPSDAECFVLLDDNEASAEQPRSRLYTGHVTTLLCQHAAEFPALLAQMQALQMQGLHAVGLFTHELGVALQGIELPPGQTGQELAQILLFKDCRHLSADETDDWLGRRATQEGDTTAGVIGLTPSVTEAEFSEAIAQIHRYIEAGDTYQVNYTYRLHFAAYGSLVALYRRLRARQAVPFGALIALADGRAVLSFSPELAVQHVAGRLSALPMKGTAAAADDAVENAARAAALAADPKNRAENLMIVDLLRNDLGRIAQLGSVSVADLFRVSRYGRVLQMTSTVEADVDPTLNLAQVLTALLPFGSVTGAPKHRTLEIIRQLEPTPRGYYTGAIGWFDAPPAGRLLGDFCLSVPIRTLLLDAPDMARQRAGEMGVGAGIVHDSVALAEFAECHLKMDFLTGLGHEFALFETMRATQDGCLLLDLHLERLFASARHFGFRYDEAAVRKELTAVFAQLPPGSPQRLRLTLEPAGEMQIEHAQLIPLQTPVTLLIAQEPINEEPLFLRHKTTRRTRYDAAWRAAEALGAFDVLFCNAQGELTEGARSSLFIKLAGRWYTPPMASGLLPGVMRKVLLADPAWSATERPLTLGDLRIAEEVMVCNALRGVLPARIDWQAHAGF
ncbi:MAG: bifunctional anthranilate synthase component I family protein/class IV aminotransferase [Rugosibacter sp.]